MVHSDRRGCREVGLGLDVRPRQRRALRAVVNGSINHGGPPPARSRRLRRKRIERIEGAQLSAMYGDGPADPRDGGQSAGAATGQPPEPPAAPPEWPPPPGAGPPGRMRRRTAVP